MSTRDSEILARLGLSCSAAAAMLGKTRQAVARGVKSTSPYLRLHDLILIYEALRKASSAQTPVLEEFIRNEFPTYRAWAQEVPAAVNDLDFPSLVCTEIWVLAAEPVSFELDHPLLSISLENLIQDTEKTLVFYTLPGRNRNTLYRRITTTLKRKHNTTSAQVYIVECPLVELIPYLIVADPMSFKPIAYVASKTQGFIELLPEETMRIVKAIREFGMRHDPNTGYDDVVIDNLEQAPPICSPMNVNKELKTAPIIVKIANSL